jgi:3-hydroxymyristoyl/3-hydroxydecanoyl-(acyl carrier protein) dehydratase
MVDSSVAIDRLRDPDGGLDRQALTQILPYGEAFLFVDRVTRLETAVVEAIYRIPESAPFIEAHFVGLPLMPGVLIGEGLAQAGTVMVRYNLERHADKDLLAFQIESARFLAPAVPGDTLEYHVKLTKLRQRAARLEGEAFVADRRVCKAALILAIVDRQLLRTELTKTPEE